MLVRKGGWRGMVGDHWFAAVGDARVRINASRIGEWLWSGDDDQITDALMASGSIKETEEEYLVFLRLPEVP